MSRRIVEIDTPPIDRLAAVMATRTHPEGGGRLTPLDPPANHAVGDIRWVWGFGRLRRGIVTKVGRTRVRVTYVCPSNPGRPRSNNELAELVYPDSRVALSGTVRA